MKDQYTAVENCKVFYREAGNPERIDAIISQNGNCYEEGLGKKWEARKEYWAHPTPELRFLRYIRIYKQIK